VDIERDEPSDGAYEGAPVEKAIAIDNETDNLSQNSI
jgi:hypothetical protein